MINLNNLDSSFNEIPTITLNDYRKFTENAGTRNYPDIFTYCDIVELVATSKNGKLVKINYTPEVVGKHGYCNHKTAHAEHVLAWVK